MLYGSNWESKSVGHFWPLDNNSAVLLDRQAKTIVFLFFLLQCSSAGLSDGWKEILLQP